MSMDPHGRKPPRCAPSKKDSGAADFVLPSLEQTHFQKLSFLVQKQDLRLLCHIQFQGVGLFVNPSWGLCNCCLP